MKKHFPAVLVLLVTACMPFILGFTVIRAALSPAVLEFEYGRAGFPRDTYGFSPTERRDLARVALDFALHEDPAEEAIALLAEQVEPATGKPLYTEGELAHMVDVKRIIDILHTINRLLWLVVLSALGVLFARSATRPRGFLAVRNGGIATVVLLTSIGAFILFAWDLFFVEFHELLFKDGTWTFSYSDGLLRLFPDQFWFDVGIGISVTTWVSGGLAALFGHWLYKKFGASRV